MSFNRRGGPDRRPDRPFRREGGPGDRQGGRNFPPRDRFPREGGDRPGPGRGPGGDRPYAPRPQQRFERPGDEGGMSIRLDPRRLQALKHLAGEAGTRPGDLVRRWVEERIDAQRIGDSGLSLEARVKALEERMTALTSSGEPTADPKPAADTADTADQAVRADGGADVEGDAQDAEPSPAVEAPTTEATAEGTGPDEKPAPAPPRRVSASPSSKVALHDEMIAVIAEHGPMTAGELAAAIVERGRYAPPRSGRALDAAMVSQRASNPTYRSRFLRREGRIGLAENPE